MRVAEAEHNHPFTLHLSAIADANDFEFARPALGHALNGIVHQGPRQPVHRGLRIILANRHEVPVFLFDLDAGRKSRVQLALRTLHQNSIAFNLDRHPFRDRDRLFSNS